jgi:hypothetical protein
VRQIRRVFVVVIAAMGLIFSDLLTVPSFAVPGVPTLAAPASAGALRDQSNAITGLTLTSNSASSVQIQVTVTHGTLTMSTITGLTFTTGDGTADVEMQFSGSPSNVQSALNTLTYTPSLHYTGSASLAFNTSPGGGLFNPDNGHFYQFIDAGVDTSWTSAKTDADAQTFGGMTGYLATVTSANEQAFVATKLNGQGWFGASDDPGQGTTETHWIWADGPEVGQEFWQGTYGGGTCSVGPCTAVSGRYNNWANGEPNNCCGSENYAHFLNNGEWNDYPLSSGITKYLVEFGGMPGDVSPLDADTTTITVASTPPTVAPSGGSVTVGNGQLGVSWTAPTDNGGATIDNYLVEYRVAGGSWTTFGTTASTSTTVTGLTNGTSYEVRVSAHNANGYGPTASVGTATPITTATAVNALSASVANGQSVVSWSAPSSNGGSAISGYKVEYSTNGTSWTQASASTTSPYTLTSLTNGTSYQVRVTPINGAGNGASTTTTVVPGAVPTAPQNVAATSERNSSVVTWTPPVSNNGYPILSYTVEYSTDGTTWTSASTAATSPYSLTGLTNGTAYQVRVTAMNSIGASGSSTASATPQGVPDPPVNVQATANVNQAVVTWGAPTETGGLPITAYKVEYRVANGTWVVASTNATSPAAITDLSPGVNYEVRVTASNALGDSAVAANTFTTIVPPATGTSVPVYVNPTTGEVSTVPAATPPNPPAAIAPTPTGSGSWTVTSDGGVFTAGDAGFFGSMGGTKLVSPAVNIVGTPTGGGYFVVASDGGVFAFGDASFQGSMGGKPLNKPVKSIATTCANDGYYLVAGDGGVFTFGQAEFHGSMAGKPLNQGMLGIVDQCGGSGYWLFAADGGVFTFGDAGFYGSLGSNPPKGGVVGMVSAPDGKGYWLIGADKKAYGFGSVA